MLILSSLRWMLLVLEVVVALPILYLCLLSFSATLASRARKPLRYSSSQPEINFAILVPAHNEEALLPQLLDSLSSLHYPQKLYTVYVVADNCSDQTAQIARSYRSVHVYERFDEQQRGKGYALQWLFQQLNQDQFTHDAFVIFDADSIVDPEFLQAMNKPLCAGAQALQGNNNVLNSSEAPSAALRWIALSLMNHVRPLGRNAISGSSTLTGNGMCLTHLLLQHYPWQAFSTTEDYQYYLSLVQAGEHVEYVPEAIVRSAMPTSFVQMRTQDVRWEGTSQGLAKWQTARNLLWEGICKHDLTRLDALAELLTPPLSLLVGLSLLALAGSIILWSLPLWLFSLVLCSGLVYYISTPLYLLHPPSTVYRALQHAPAFILWKLWVYLVLRRSKKQSHEWVRTSRAVSTK